MPTMRQAARWGSVAAAMGVVVLLLSAFGSSSGRVSSGSPFASKGSIRGQHITVLLPYQVNQSILNQFTRQTGVKLTFETAGWNNVKSKLIVANEAGTYIADVTEFDWSFTGQFGGSGWYEPLGKALGPKVISDLGNVNKAFDTKGHTYAACYSNDYRLSEYNTRYFAAAGIKKFPKTFSQLDTDLNILKQKKVASYPMSLPLAATEGGVEPWYVLTLAMGGQLFNAQNKPVFGRPNSTALKALEWEIEALKNGWISPGSVTTDNVPAQNNFNAGDTAVVLASGPGKLPSSNDPSVSKVAGHVGAALMPGLDGAGPAMPLPEGLAIPVTAEHKAAALAFIKWWLEPKTQVELYTKGTGGSFGFLPCSKTAFSMLVKSGKLESGAVLQQELSHIVPLFPDGAPVWYSKFDTEAQQLINAAVEGHMSPRSALSQLASYTSSVDSSSS